MASVHIARFVDMDFMFNIGAGVGRARPNSRFDVMLVQYLLNLATNESVAGPLTSDTPIRPPESPSDLVPDGVFGPKTQRFIEHYQKFRNAQTQFSGGNKMKIGFQVKEDGAIDPWQFPARIAITAAGGALTRSETMTTLSYDAAKNDEVRRGTFRSMPPELVRRLCAR